MSKALHIEEVAAEWLARLDKIGRAPEPKDAVSVYSNADGEFATWVNASLEHRLAFLRLYSAWWRASRLVMLAPSSIAPLPGKRWWPRVSVAAAACLLIGLIALMVGYRPLQGWEVHETRVGQRETVMLSDGSRVELNTDARIAIHLTGDTRSVVIERGEAYFDVAKDASRPFVVEAGDSRLVVLGTQFNVRRRESDVKILVAEGQVRIESRRDDSAMQPIVATRGVMAVARIDGVIIEQRSELELAADLGWLRGMLIFEHKDLASIAAEFNRYNRIQLVPGDAESGATPIGGSFRVNNVESFVRLLETDFGFRAERHGERILIRKNSSE